MKREVILGIILILLLTLVPGCSRVSQEEFDTVVADKEALQSQITSLQNQLTNVQDTLNSTNLEKSAVETQLSDLQAQVTKAQNDLASTVSQLNTSKATIVELELEVNILEAEIDELEVYIDALTKQMANPSTEEKPQYGGQAYIALTTAPVAFDEAFGPHQYVTTLHLTNEEMMQGYWIKGPAGTGEADFILGGINSISLKNGSLADWWEIPEKGKMIFHLREGVKWINKAPTNGRELTVEDVVYSFNRICTESGSYIKATYPLLCKDIKISGDATARTVTVDATACPATEWTNVVALFPDFVTVMPKDAVEQFGNMNNWQNSIGTGPFIMTNYVANSTIDFIRNPNYWMSNPIGPGTGDKLPYLDSVKMYIILDAATRIAAFRTGKIDFMGGEYIDIKAIVDSPDFKHKEYTQDYSMVISMRTDKVDLPFSKKEVRQALTMAIDFNAIKEQYYGGKATIFNWPICYTREYSGAFVPLEQLPVNCQNLYSHNINKAKELLSYAGWANGFNATVITNNTVSNVEYLSLVKSMWNYIGVTLTIQVTDLSVYTTTTRTRNYSSMIYHSTSNDWQKMYNFTGQSMYNMSYVNDPTCNDAFTRAQELIGVDEVKLAQNFANLVPYVVEQCFQISRPNPYNYVLWRSWVKNWNGELNVGYYNYPSYLKYIWIDATLKQ